MSVLANIIGDPYRRTKTTYHFKIQDIKGNDIYFHDASKVVNKMTLTPDTEFTLEEQYDDMLNNLFVAFNITGEYFFYQKVSNTQILKP